MDGNTFPTVNSLMSAILALLPYAEFGEDLNGQIIIYTDLSEVGSSGELVTFSEVHHDA